MKNKHWSLMLIDAAAFDPQLHSGNEPLFLLTKDCLGRLLHIFLTHPLLLVEDANLPPPIQIGALAASAVVQSTQEGKKKLRPEDNGKQF